MRCDYDRAEDFRLISGRVGAMIDIELGAGARANWSPRIQEAEQWLLPAVLLNQNAIFTDQAGKPFAYVTWAYLSRRNHDRMLLDHELAFRLDDWMEGPFTWIVDAVSVSGPVEPLLTWAADALGQDCSGLYYRRRCADRFTEPLRILAGPDNHDPARYPAKVLANPAMVPI